MRSRGLSRTFLTAVCLGVLLFGGITATAKDGRDFAGTYSLSSVQPQGANVLLTLRVKLSNYSGADISGAVVTLMKGHPEVGLRGSFPTVKTWRKGQAVKLSAQFTIPKRELETWSHQPAQPDVVIIYQDANGQTWQRGAQLRPEPVL